MDKDMIVTVTIDYRGERHACRHCMSQIDMDDCWPSRNPLSPFEAYEEAQRREKRKRLVDMISSNIAYRLEDYIGKRGRE